MHMKTILKFKIATPFQNKMKSTLKHIWWWMVSCYCLTCFCLLYYCWRRRSSYWLFSFIFFFISARILWLRVASSNFFLRASFLLMRVNHITVFFKGWFVAWLFFEDKPRFFSWTEIVSLFTTPLYISLVWYSLCFVTCNNIAEGFCEHNRLIFETESNKPLP